MCELTIADRYSLISQNDFGVQWVFYQLMVVQKKLSHGGEVILFM